MSEQIWTVRPAWTRGRNGDPRRCGWNLMHGDSWAQTFSRKRDAQAEADRQNAEYERNEKLYGGAA